MSRWRRWLRQSCAAAAMLGLASLPVQAAPRRGTVVMTGVVNLNQASASELDLLPGVGVKAAQRIIDHRARKPFSRPEELVRVKGFGKKRFDALKAHLSVQGPTTLKVEQGPSTRR